MREALADELYTTWRMDSRAVVVMACDEGILPVDEHVADAADMDGNWQNRALGGRAGTAGGTVGWAGSWPVRGLWRTREETRHTRYGWVARAGDRG